ncbi:MAG: ATP synthase F1 subunit gamma [Candidatus Cryptobacteroides sp.]
MAALKEIKERIGSVKSTLKITSAMKLLSSAKLHKTQQLVTPLSEYRAELEKCLETLDGEALQLPVAQDAAPRCCVVALSSNTSLCGGFNSAIIKLTSKVLEESGEDPVCYFIGKKINEAMAKAGYQSRCQIDKILDKPSYTAVCQLAEELIKGFEAGEYREVKIVYSHHCSAARQEPLCQSYLPVQLEGKEYLGEDKVEDIFILEPDKKAIQKELLYKVLKIQLYSILLDSCLAEHSARTVAMQTATDNGENMLSELTLEYNKTRQASITAEILDLAGGNTDR